MMLLITLDFMASDGRMVSVWQIERDEEGSIVGQVWGTVPQSVWRDKNTMQYLRIVSVPAEIRTGSLSVTSQKHHLLVDDVPCSCFYETILHSMLMGCPSMAVWFLPLTFCFKAADRPSLSALYSFQPWCWSTTCLLVFIKLYLLCEDAHS